MKKTGEKFTERYHVASATIYKGAPENLRIPGPDHPLYDPTAPTTYDPLRVDAIERDGKMTTAIEVWTEPDTGIMWVLDGRGRLRDVWEVNRRRAKDHRELVEPYIVPFSGDEKAAVARVREKNYHRRLPTISGMAIDLLALRKAGWDCAKCADILHVETIDPEQWVRKLLPLAHCVPEVRKAIDEGLIPKASARVFGGTGIDGEGKLGPKEQLAKLAEMTAPAPAKPRGVPPKARERVVEALNNGASAKLKGEETLVADVVAATLEYVASGDLVKFTNWPAVAKIVASAAKPEKARAAK